MHIVKMSVNGSPNVGLYGYATQEYLLWSEQLQDKAQEELQAALGDVPVYRVRIAGTTMIGVFVAGNSKTLLVPSIAFDSERKKLEEHNIPYTVIHSSNTCLGNNIACNDHGAIISTEFSEHERAQIEKALGVPTVCLDIAGLKTPGAVLALNGDKGVVHRDASVQERHEIERILKVKLTPATANLGTPYLHAAILNNAHGFAIGDQSGGPEIVHIDEALGYLEDE